MKKTLLITLALLLVCVFASCGEFNYEKEDLTPYVTLGSYSGMELDANLQVNDATVDNEIFMQMIYYPLPDTEITDRPAEDGDKVSVHYEGAIDGVAFEGGTGDSEDLYIGSGAMIPGFEEGIIGMNIGETKTVDATFPEDYGNEELNGKTAQFTITLNGIYESRGISMDNLEEYAAEYGYESGDAFRETVREYCLANAKNEIWEKVVEDAEVLKYPAEVKTIQKNYINYSKYYLEEEYTEDYARQLAESSVKQDLVLYSIVKEQGFTATKDEYSAKLAELAAAFSAQYGQEVDGKTYMKLNGLKPVSVYRNIYLDKALDYIYENAVFPEEEELPDLDESIEDLPAEPEELPELSDVLGLEEGEAIEFSSPDAE